MSQWILTKNLMPEETLTPMRKKAGLGPASDVVLVTLLDPQVEDGTRPPYAGDGVVVADRFSKGKLIGHKGLTWGGKTIPVAWMPMPEPYRPT